MLIKSNITKEIKSITTAIAVAPVKSYCSSFVIIKSVLISVLNGIFPAIKTTDPYSPKALANESANPVRTAGKIVGRITL